MTNMLGITDLDPSMDNNPYSNIDPIWTYGVHQLGHDDGPNQRPHPTLPAAGGRRARDGRLWCSDGRSSGRSARAKQHATVTVFCLLAGAVVVLASFYLMCWLGATQFDHDPDYEWSSCAKLGFKLPKPGAGSGSDGSGYS